MRVKLKDVCEKATSNLKQSDILSLDGKYPVYGASGYLGNIDSYHQDKPYIAVVKDGAGIGRTTILPPKSSVIGTMQYLIPKETVMPEYLYYVVKHMRLQKYYTGATIPHIYFKDYQNEEFNLADSIRQREIVKVLKNVEDTIRYQEIEINKFDELIKARFIEMFGDPIINSKKLPTKSVINVVTLQRGYDLPNKERHKDGIIPLYGANGQFDWHDTSKACHGIITGRSGSIGQVYYCETEFWPLNTTLFSVDNHGNNIIYLSYLLDFFDLKRFSNGTGVPTLNRNLIHKENIIDVPLISQNQFADFVQQVDKSREEVKKSLEKTQQLYDSLMQEYFG